MSAENAALKRLRESLPDQVTEALEKHVVAAARWATIVRLVFAVTFAAAGLRLWSHQSNARIIYLVLAAVWLILAVSARARAESAESFVSTTTMIDVTVVSLGLLAFVQQGLFPHIGAGMFMCYFPILAVAATRYRIGLVINTALYASIFYLVLSLYAGAPPWFRLSMLAVTAAVMVFGSRKPKDLVVEVAQRSLEEAYRIGSTQTSMELMARTHELFMPPAIVDLPEIWSSSKHGVGAESGGDYFQIFQTLSGPLVVLGDLPGLGFESLANIARIHRHLDASADRNESLSQFASGLSDYLWDEFKGARTMTAVFARWEGEQLHYINAGHLPALQIGKADQHRLPVNNGPLGAAKGAEFTEGVVPFPPRDLLVLYTDGVFAKLTADREEGAGQIEKFAEQFRGGEVNTLCHRIFDCAHPGFDPNRDDSTVVVIRRQPAADAKSAK